MRENEWLKNRVRFGWFFIGFGVFLFLLGVYLQVTYSYSPFNFRIISGLGILVVGIGIGIVVKYMSLRKGDLSAKRLLIEEKDERNLLIRYRAGYRGFWVALIMVYSFLMWISFSANGSLPKISEELSWYLQAACVVIPFIIYIISIVRDQKRI